MTQPPITNYSDQLLQIIREAMGDMLSGDHGAAYEHLKTAFTLGDVPPGNDGTQLHQRVGGTPKAEVGSTSPTKTFGQTISNEAKADIAKIERHLTRYF